MRPIKDTRVPLENGTRVGEYVIESLLAKGGSALTYFAHKTTNGSKCVIKEGYPIDSSGIFKRDGLIVTSEDVDLDKNKREQIKRLFENEITKSNEYRCFLDNNSERVFEHESITDIIKNDPSFSGTICSYICIDTSYGKTMYDIIDEDNLTLKNKFIYLREAAITLDELIHKKGCIHADITPKNLFFPLEFKAEKVFCRILDFGSSFSLNELTTDTWISKSEKFSSPEIVDRYTEQRYAAMDPLTKKSCFIERIGYGSDIYSLGRCMMFLLMGKDKFNKESCLEEAKDDIYYGEENAFEQYLDNDYKVLSPLIIKFLKRCLYYDAENYDKSIRPSTQEFIDEMNLYIDIIENRAFHPAVLAIGSRKNKPKEFEKTNILQEWLADIKSNSGL